MALSQQNIIDLAKIRVAEAIGENQLGQRGVIGVVLDRWKSSEYPNTIEGVIEDKKFGVQFTPMKNRSLADLPMPAPSVIADTKTYATGHMDGSIPAANKGATSFSVGGADILPRDKFKIGNHWFGYGPKGGHYVGSPDTQVASVNAPAPDAKPEIQLAGFDPARAIQMAQEGRTARGERPLRGAAINQATPPPEAVTGQLLASAPQLPPTKPNWEYDPTEQAAYDYLQSALGANQKAAGRDYYVDQLAPGLATKTAKMIEAARADGIDLYVISGARAREDQRRAIKQSSGRFPVASETGSRHVKGGYAVDIGQVGAGWNDKYLKQDAKDWIDKYLTKNPELSNKVVPNDLIHFEEMDEAGNRLHPYDTLPDASFRRDLEGIGHPMRTAYALDGAPLVDEGPEFETYPNLIASPEELQKKLDEEFDTSTADLPPAPQRKPAFTPAPLADQAILDQPPQRKPEQYQPDDPLAPASAGFSGIDPLTLSIQRRMAGIAAPGVSGPRLTPNQVFNPPGRHIIWPMPNVPRLLTQDRPGYGESPSGAPVAPASVIPPTAAPKLPQQTSTGMPVPRQVTTTSFTANPSGSSGSEGYDYIPQPTVRPSMHTRPPIGPARTGGYMNSGAGYTTGGGIPGPHSYDTVKPQRRSDPAAGLDPATEQYPASNIYGAKAPLAPASAGFSGIAPAIAAPKLMAPVPQLKPTAPRSAAQSAGGYFLDIPVLPAWQRAGAQSEQAYNSIGLNQGLAGAPQYNITGTFGAGQPSSSGGAGIRNPDSGTTFVTYNPFTGSTWNWGGGGGGGDRTGYDPDGNFR